MQEITNQLLQAASSASSSASSNMGPSPDVVEGTSRMMRSILDENRDFLLEPLERNDAVLDPDSVLYQGGAAPISLPRSERYKLYRNELQERIDRARNGASRQVLQALHDFVREHE
jgi:hypothetical protein